jgi:hypothetical protein
MPELEFDLDKSFEENLDAFKRHVTALDPLLAAILLKHLDKLHPADEANDRASRTEFNRAVLADLEALSAPPIKAGGT